MKKVYSIMLALLAMLCVGTAYAEDPDEGTLSPITITLNVDDPAAVQIFANENWSSPITLTAGNNLLTITPQEDWMGPYYPDVTLQVAEGFGVNEITASAAGVPPFYLQYAGVYMLSPSELSDGVTYTITTYAYADMRTDSVIVLIDDKTKATMSYGNGQAIVLESTENVVYFSSDEVVADLPLIVRAAGWDSYLYKVTLNDSVITDYGRGYQMYDVESGDTIQISANAPADLTFPVIFQWEEGADRASFDSLQVDGVKVDYKDTIDVAWGKEVTMWLNAKEYLVKVNNSTVSKYSNNYSEVILDTTVWEISSAKYEDFDVTIIAHNAGCIDIQKSIDYSYIKLVEGENTISLNSSDSRIYIRRTEDCVIDSVKVNGKLEESFSSILCEKNMTIEIWGDSIRRDQTFMLYVDTVANYQYTIRTATSTYLAYYYSGPYLTNGYNQFAFANADNPINFSVGYGRNPVCYQNDSIVPLSWGSCSLKLANNDVVKVFADTAKVYNVDFVLKGGATATVTKDRIVAVDATNFTVLQGTEVSFKTTETNILVNGEAAEAVDGVVTLTINENTTIQLGEAKHIANTAENPYTIAEAIALTQAGQSLEDTVFVIGVVKNIGTSAANVAKYGNVDVYLTQDTLEYQFRYMLNIGGAKFADLAEVNATFTAGDTLIAKGTLTYYEAKDRYQLKEYCQLVEVRKSTVEPEPEPEPEVVSCAVANAAAKGTAVALNEVVVAFVNGKNNFIQDAEGWTLLYLENAGLKAGDRVSGIKGTVDVYFGTPEVVPSNKAEWTITAGEAPAPAVQQTTIANTDINHFIKLEGVSLNGAFTSDNNYTVEGTWKGETVAIYDKFKSNESFVEGLYDVVGIVAIFNDKLQLNFISATTLTEGLINASVESQAEKFVRDGQLIIRMNGVEYNVLGAKIQ